MRRRRRLLVPSLLVLCSLLGAAPAEAAIPGPWGGGMADISQSFFGASSAIYPVAAIGDDGTAIVAWATTSGGTISVRRHAPVAQSWTAETINEGTGGTVGSLAGAVGPDGTAVLVWSWTPTAGATVTHVSNRPAIGAWHVPFLLPESVGTYALAATATAVDVAWVAETGFRDRIDLATVVTETSSIGAITTVAPAPILITTSSLSLTANRSGDEAVVWANGGGPWVVTAATRDGSAAPWSTPIAISTLATGGPRSNGLQPSSSLGTDGTLAVSWIDGGKVLAKVRARGQAFPPAATLWPSGATANNDAILADGHGAIATWGTFDPSAGEIGHRATFENGAPDWTAPVDNGSSNSAIVALPDGTVAQALSNALGQPSIDWWLPGQPGFEGAVPVAAASGFQVFVGFAVGLSGRSIVLTTRDVNQGQITPIYDIFLDETTMPAPTFRSGPAIADASHVGLGDSLSCTPAATSDAASFTYAWRVNGVVDTNATGQGRIIAEASASIECGETITNAAGSVTAWSAPVVTSSLPTPTGFATITGTARVGATLQCAATFTPYAQLTFYAWLVDGVASPALGTGATSSPLPPSSLGRTLQCTVDGGGPSKALSLAVVVARGAAPIARTAPSLRGKARKGSTLTCVPGTWSVVGPLTYAWLRDGRAIAKATRSTYRVVAADRKHRVSCRVTDSPAGYTPGSATTATLLGG